MLFDLKLHVIIKWHKYFLNHLSFFHNTILTRTNIIKSNLFPVCAYLLNMYKSIDFHLLDYYTSTWKVVCFSKCTTNLKSILNRFSQLAQLT